jgi:hypothetical protein
MTAQSAAFVSLERARALFDYDREAGTLRWKQKSHPKSPARIGDLAGTPTPRGIVIRVGRTLCKAHRIIWLLERGEPVPKYISFYDRNPLNPRIGNLRGGLASSYPDGRALQTNNKSGVKGVFYYQKFGKWRATIGSLRIGDYDTLEQAAEARRLAVEAFNAATPLPAGYSPAAPPAPDRAALPGPRGTR